MWKRGRMVTDSEKERNNQKERQREGERENTIKALMREKKK